MLELSSCYNRFELRLWFVEKASAASFSLAKNLSRDCY